MLNWKQSIKIIPRSDSCLRHENQPEHLGGNPINEFRGPRAAPVDNNQQPEDTSGSAGLNPIDEFRRVTMLLSLLANINSGGRQVTIQSPEPMLASLERAQPLQRLAMNALANLLVHKDEVVAVTCSTSSNNYISDISGGESGSDSILPASDMEKLTNQEVNPISEAEYMEVGILNFYALANPERPTSMNNLSSAWQDNPTAAYMVVPPGRSSWKVVSERPWSQLNKGPTLADHAATLQEYLAEYQAMEQTVMQDNGVEVMTAQLASEVVERRIRAFDTATRYLLSTCSPKMRSRLKHPVSKEYSRRLYSITAADLRSASSSTPIPVHVPTRQRDLPLCDVMLSTPDLFNTLTAYVRHQVQLKLPPTFEFTALRSTFSKLHDFRMSGATDISKCPALYTAETVVEFHFLLLAVLTGYKGGLEELANRPSNPAQDVDDCNLSWIFAFLLWRIAHSTVLREHLAFLHAAGLLKLDHAGRWKGGFRLEKDDADTADAETADADEEMSVMQLHSTATEGREPDMGLVFLRWIRLLVCHLTALETLSLFFRHGPLNNMRVNIQIVALRPSPIEKTEWRPVLKRALQSEAPFLLPHYEKIVSTLLDHIKDGRGERFSFFHHFSDWSMDVSGVVHSEAALACLLRYLSAVTAVPGAALQLEVGEINCLAVSKLCCPVCWQLLSLLDSLDWRFGVRGHHNKMFPVQLPSWISVETADVMLKLFRQRLTDEVSDMMGPKPKGRPSTSSVQSVGSLAPSSTSVISNSTVTSGDHTSGPRRDIFQYVPFKRLFKLTNYLKS